MTKQHAETTDQTHGPRRTGDLARTAGPAQAEGSERTTTSARAQRPEHTGPTVAVLGPGGVGGLIAALLSRSGHRVICLAREDTADTLRTDGIQVRSRRFGDFTAPVEADTELREPVDACLVTVKHTGLDDALARVPAAALGDALLVPFLNGVEHPAALRARYRPALVAPAVIRVESTRTAPGVIEHGSPFMEIDLTGDTAPRARLDALAATLSAAGPATRVVEDETAALWAKMAFLAPLALLTTRYGLPLGEVRDRYDGELRSLVAETAAVSHACGAPADPAAALARYAAFPAATRSSMQRDAEAGRPLELDAIGGALLRAAARHGVPVPVAARIVGELRGGGL
ncbi:ketopantoate reductase family protein [Streptomyces sp. NPDC004596]